ncbi:hypothetical protein BKA82DRAFT_2709507 [Pisolithus tinctorius]|nr:hypothetical protein BKA82DRAFT_2709507 [Pisolithus tinctorius]
MGYVSWIEKDVDNSAVLVDILCDCGAAVPFVGTNVPQTQMTSYYGCILRLVTFYWWGEKFNNIRGRTSNSHKRFVTSGGSSGDEVIPSLLGLPLTLALQFHSHFGSFLRCLWPATFLRPCPIWWCSEFHGRLEFDSVRPWLGDPLAVREHRNHEKYKLANHGHGKDLCFAVMWDDEVVIHLSREHLK